MGIEAVNHFLSLRPVMDFAPVHAVRRDMEQEKPLEPATKPIVLWPQATQDSISKAHAPFFAIGQTRAPVSKLTVAESCAILARISREKARVDYLQDFPGLLKV